MRILIVEDEPKVGSFIRRALEEESYAVDVCSDGIQGRDFACEVNYDLIILDLMLPGLPGIEVLKAIRGAKVKTPILILTARSEVDQRVKGLDAGADVGADLGAPVVDGAEVFEAPTATITVKPYGALFKC